MQYLTKIRNGRTAHLWHGGDTYCRMASTGGLNPKRYMVLDRIPRMPVCRMCITNARKDGVLLEDWMLLTKAQLENEKQLVFETLRRR